MAAEESAQTSAELLERAVAFADKLGLDLVAVHVTFAEETLRAVEAASAITLQARSIAPARLISPLDESDQSGNKWLMDTPSPVALASMILSAPGWARVGIAAPSERTRAAAALELGALIAERMVSPVEPAPDGQMALPL